MIKDNKNHKLGEIPKKLYAIGIIIIIFSIISIYIITKILFI